MGIGWLHERKISENSYEGRVEQGWRGVNPSRHGCVEAGCSNLDGLEEVRKFSAEAPEKNGKRRERGTAETQRTQRKAAAKAPQMTADEHR
jgi:hypothetical protein